MKNNKKIIFKNTIVITPFEEKKNYNVIIEGNLIKDMFKDFNEIKEKISNEEYEIYDLKNKYLVPGFIDIHTHGACGVTTYSSSILPWSEYNIKNGVTSFLPTLFTMPIEEMYASIKTLVREIKEKINIVKIIGLNLEGPYINPAFGCQLGKNCLIPRKLDYTKLIELSEGCLKIMTVAPELDGTENLIRELIKNKIIVSIGHTNASSEDTLRAIDLGATLCTHIFNAFGFSEGAFKKTVQGKYSGVREVKALEILLQRDDIFAEVVSDKEGIHVHPILLNILLKCKSMDKIIVISDNMNSAGMPDGDYNMPDGRKYSINSKSTDVIWIEKNSMLGGVIYKLKDGVKNFMNHTGISFKDAIKTITINPAKLLGIDYEVGSIKIGKKADLVVIDSDFNVYITIIDGKIVYRNKIINNMKNCN